MALFDNKEKADVVKNAPPKTGAALLGSTVWRELRSLLTLNFMMDLFWISPLMAVLSVLFAAPRALIVIMLILGIISLICLPAAITAENRITATMVRDENFFLWQDFKKAFTKNFGKALAGGFVYTLLITVFVFAGTVYYSMFGKSMLFSIIAAFDLCLIIIVFTASLYYWTMLAYVELPFGALFKNSLIMVLGCWKRSLLAWLTELVTVLLFLFVKMDLIILLLGLFVIALNSLMINFAIYPAIYDKVIKKSEHETGSFAQDINSEPLSWDSEDELKSASIDSLDFGSDDEEDK
ncbi:MAG: hypothetical protein MJ059_04235 [Lachnospiraceae bacterium]|nr:hypothetical protein [Lachnospiraceae bacterium]